MAFHGLSAHAARDLVARVYGAQLAGASGNPAASVAAAGHIVGYVNNHIATIRTSAGVLERETSSVPLRTDRGTSGPRAVSLSLSQHGGSFEPLNPLLNISIADRLARGVTLDAANVKFIPVGADVSGRPVIASGLLYPNIGPDEDATISATLSGTELSTVLRSRRSPQQIRYRVVLPGGATLRALGGGAVISAGHEVVRIMPPTARDAQGQTLPVHLRVAGDELILDAPHHNLSVAYPILVDPIVTTNHCCGEWSFEGPEWEELFPGAPGWNIGPGFMEALPGLHESFFGEALFWNNEWQKHHGWEDTRQEFTGVSYVPYATEPEWTKGWLGGLCDEWTSVGFGAPPSTLIFPNAEYKRPPKSICSPDGFGMGLEVNGSAEFATAASLSVAAVLITARSESARKHHRRRGPRHREVLGANNPGEPNQVRACEGEPVDCATGNAFETQTDLNIPGRGIPLALQRTYNSQVAVNQTSPGPFGYGWSASFGDRLNISASTSTVTVEQANGSTVTFTGNPTVPGELTPPPWSQAKLLVESSGAFLYTLPNQTLFHFSAAGTLSSVIDHNGNTTSMTYSGGHLTAVTDPAGRVLKLKYNAGGQVESVTDPLSHVVKYAYEAGNLTSVTEPGEASPRWKIKYDASHQLTELVDGRGGNTLNEFNAAHQVVLQTDPMGRTLRFEYEELKSKTLGEYALPLLCAETPAEEQQEEVGPEEIVDEVVVPAPEQVTRITHEGTGAVTLEHYNPEDELEYATTGYGSATPSTRRFSYTGSHNVASVTDGNEHTTKFEYDAEGNRVAQIAPNSAVTKWEYNKAHHVIATTAPSGETTTIKREAHGNVESLSRPAPGEQTQTTKFKYTAFGQLETTTDPLARVTKYEYTVDGDLASETDPEGDKRTWEYNKDSQAVATVSPRGNVKGVEASKYTTKFEVDQLGRPLTTTDPLGHKTKYTYDADGNLETLTDPNTNKTKYVYDADNEQTKVEAPNGAVQEAGYDALGHVTSLTDGNKHTTRFVLNSLEAVTEIVDPRERRVTKERDAAGNVTTVTDAAGRKATYSYDPGDRLREVSYSDGKTHSVQYEYNADGKVTVMTDGSGVTKYTYDQLDRLVETENGHKEVTKYEYDLGNEVTKVTYPNGKTVTHTFDKAGRLEKITDWLTHATKFSYDADSELLAVLYPTETKDEDKYAYGFADQMSEAKMLKGAETLASLVYTRDSAGQVKGATSKGLPGEEAVSYEYDANSRLTKGAGVGYEYDAANGPTKVGASTLKYDAAGELESATGATFAYDEMGQRATRTPTSGPATTYGYDQAANLVSVERPKEGEVPKIEDSYAYNGEHLRVSQTLSGVTSYLDWDKTAAIPVVLADGTNNYIYGPHGAPVEQINSTTGTVTYLHHDQAGSTRLLTGSTGVVTGKCTYGAYGAPTCEGTATTPLGYDAQYTNSDTGLIYMRARTYDPATAQFLSVDPLEMVTRAPYNYAGDNPVNHSDPTGLGEWEPWTESFWTEGNFISNSPLNPIPYYEKEVESYEEGCGYFASVTHGLEGTLAGAALFAGGEGADEADITVSDLLEGKLGKITKAPLPPGSPAWADIQGMSIADVRAAAKANQPGFKMIYKLLNDNRFNKP